MANGEKNLVENRAKVLDVIQSGKAMAKFKQMVIAQRRGYSLFG